MPFAYFGAKHGLARYYPPPAFDTIIEPFAGSAGYSVYWATTHKVHLYDSDRRVIDLWHQLQGEYATALILDAERQWAENDYVNNPLLYSIGCGLYRVKEGNSAKKSSVMVDMWPGIRRRIEAVLPMIAKWHITCLDYREVANREGTWFIDPPYSSIDTSKAGNRYGHKANDLNYLSLANWSKERHGQVIVCEQAPAEWLEFSPLRSQRTRFRDGDPQVRFEVAYAQGPVSPLAEFQREQASARRWKRMKPRTDKWAPKKN